MKIRIFFHELRDPTWHLIFCLVVAGIIIFWAFFHNGEWWSIALLILPLLIELLGWGFLPKAAANDRFYKFYDKTMMASIVCYLLAWALYLSERHIPWLSGYPLSLLSFFAALSLIGSVVYVTYVMMSTTGDNKQPQLNDSKEEGYLQSSNLKEGLKQFPFWRLMHFFSIFITVTYLFGFAFAFHDINYRRHEKVALHMEDFSNSKEALKKMDETPATGQEAGRIPNVLTTYFYFDEKRAELETDTKKQPATDKTTRCIKNIKSQTEVISAIEKTPDNSLPLITLIGRADEDSLNEKSAYLSNYELAQARTGVVKYELTKALIGDYKNLQNIAWNIVIYSNEQTSQPANQCSDEEFHNKKSKNRVVELLIEYIPNPAAAELNVMAKVFPDKSAPYQPQLMDYMYFSVYTITTTGYGDIKPATYYAKFLISIENFIEVFFLVGFFNTLLSLKEPKGSKPYPSEAPKN